MGGATRMQNAAPLGAEHFDEIVDECHDNRLRCRPAANEESYMKAAGRPSQKMPRLRAIITDN
jgi:hypothetical protein